MYKNKIIIKIYLISVIIFLNTLITKNIFLILNNIDYELNKVKFNKYFLNNNNTTKVLT